MSTLIISDSPFMNYKHTNFAYDLCLNIVNQGKEIYYLINNFIINSNTNKFSVINLNDMLANFHKNTLEHINKINPIIKFLSMNEIEKMNKIKFIIRHNENVLEQDFLDNIVSEFNVNELYFSGCYAMKINENIKFYYPKIRKLLFFDTPIIPINKFHENLISQFDEIINMNPKYNEQLKTSFNKNTHYLKYNFPLIHNFEFNLYPTDNTEFITKKYENKIKYNIPLNKKIFLVDIDGYDITLQEIKLLDLYFRLIEKLNKDFPNKYFFIFNVPNDFIFQHIHGIFEKKRKEKFDMSCISIITDYYLLDGGFPWKYQYPDLVMCCDGVICLSGFELNHNSSYIANLFNIPVFYNNNNNYLKTEVNNGYSHDTNIPLFVANKIQSFIMYPPFKYVYENFINFIQNNVNNNKYYFNNEFLPDYNNYYNELTQIIG
jgi:hypothetical protein